MRENKGVTLVALVITVIVLGIIASISIYSGKEMIKSANLEALKTNMLMIQAKAREYVEEVSFKMGPTPDEGRRPEIRAEVYETTAKLQKASESGENIPSQIPTDNCYYVTPEALESWGLNKIELEEGEAYFVKFDETNLTVEVYNNIGFNNVYSLTEIDKIEL